MMNSYFNTALSSVLAFVATNLDDLLILMIFFSQINSQFRKRHIILGQYMGFTLLILISLLGILGTFLIPKEWIGLLGFIPIIIGVKKIFSLYSRQSETTKVGEITLENTKTNLVLGTLISPYTYSVAAITAGNGGDNISIYVPLLAHSTWVEFLLTILIFYLLVGLWCYFGYKLAKNSLVSKVLEKYKDISEVIILIGLGIFILFESNAISVLF